MTPRVLLVGLGSIGTRHARLLRTHFPELDLVALRSGSASPGNELGLPELHGWDEVDRQTFDVAVIANPTSLHIDTARLCAERGMHLFLEKPIDARLDGLDELIAICQSKQLTSYVAYPLRFHAVIGALRERLARRQVRHVRMVCASYLPDWRPGRAHLDVYSAHARMGGGVLLDMSHELDLAQYLFGPVRSLRGTLRRTGDVTVDAEDCADVLLSHDWGTTNISLTMISRSPRRVISIETADGYLAADIRAQTVTDLRDGNVETITLTAGADNMYVAQLRYFFGNLGRTEIDNNLLQASDLYRKMIALREEEGYGTSGHYLRSRRIAGSEGQEYPPDTRQAPDRLHD